MSAEREAARSLPEGAARLLVGEIRDAADLSGFSSSQLRSARLYTGGASAIARRIDAELASRLRLEGRERGGA